MHVYHNILFMPQWQYAMIYIQYSTKSKEFIADMTAPKYLKAASLPGFKLNAKQRHACLYFPITQKPDIYPVFEITDSLTMYNCDG